MKGRERIQAVLGGGMPDRVPYFDFIMSRRFVKYFTNQNPDMYQSEDIVQCCRKAGIDAAWIPAAGFMGCEYAVKPAIESSGDSYTDEFGVRFRRVPSSWPVNAPVSPVVSDTGDVKNFFFPETGRDRLEDIDAAVRLSGGETAIFAGIQGPLRSAWFLMGFENLCINLFDDPGCVTSLFQKSTDFYKSIVEQLENMGVDGVVISEDMGFSTSSYFSPDTFRQYVFPFQRELIRHVKKLGIPVILHSDGNLNSIIDDLIGMACDAYHPFERKAGMDIFAIREKYPDAVLIGNIDSKVTLAEGNLETIKADAQACIWKLGARGRYCLASDHSIHDGIDPETIVKLVEIARTTRPDCEEQDDG